MVSYSLWIKDKRRAAEAHYYGKYGRPKEYLVDEPNEVSPCTCYMCNHHNPSLHTKGLKHE